MVKRDIEGNLWINFIKSFFTTGQMNYGLLIDIAFIIAGHYQCAINRFDVDRRIFDVNPQNNNMENQRKVESRVIPLAESYRAYIYRLNTFFS